MKIDKIQQIEHIIGPDFQLFHKSRFGNYVVYKIDMNRLNSDQINGIIAELVSNNYYPSFDKRDGNF